MTTPDTPAAAADSLPRWDLSDLYAGPDDPRLDAALVTALADAQAFAARYRGKVASLSPSELDAALTEYERIEQEASKPGLYAGLRFAADAASSETGALVQRVRERTTEAMVPLLCFDVDLTTLGAERLDALANDPALTRWHHYLGTVRDQATHRLTESEERILEEKANTGGRAFVRLYEELTSNLRFTIPGRDGEMTLSEVLDLQQSPDREVRKASADALTAGLEPHARTIAYIFNTLIQDKATSDRLRHYASPEDARHLANELTPEIVDTVVGTAVDGYPLVARFYETKKRLLGLPELAHYDRYAPLGGAERDIPWDAARDRVLGAFSRFDPEYESAAGKFFTNAWIDAGPRPGKRGGAFCSYITPDLHPYVFLNYLGKGGDVRTLAHELGHAVHNYLARIQSFTDFHGTLPMAEVASTFAEQLVFEDTVAGMGEDEKLAEYARQIESAIATIFRQAALYRFEQAIHRERREMGELTVARFGELWQENVGAMFGDAVTLEEGHALWWSYIRHFVATPFYVYAYTFGEMLALALYRKYRTEGGGFAPRYLDMLRAGGSKTPQELVAPLGVDLTDAAFWRGALDVLAEQVAAFEKLAASRGR
jgi:oligoendopeptidase F